MRLGSYGSPRDVSGLRPVSALTSFPDGYSDEERDAKDGSPPRVGTEFEVCTVRQGGACDDYEQHVAHTGIVAAEAGSVRLRVAHALPLSVELATSGVQSDHQSTATDADPGHTGIAAPPATGGAVCPFVDAWWQLSGSPTLRPVFPVRREPRAGAAKRRSNMSYAEAAARARRRAKLVDK